MRYNLKLQWSEDSRTSLNGVLEYYKDKDKAFAKRLVKEIRQQAKVLKNHPFFGRNTSKKGVQRLIIAGTSYFLPYKLLPNDENPETVYIINAVSSLEDSKAKKYL